MIKGNEIEPGLEGTLIGKLRLFMRLTYIWERSPAQILDALDRAGLEIVHKTKKPDVMDEQEAGLRRQSLATGVGGQGALK